MTYHRELRCLFRKRERAVTQGRVNLAAHVQRRIDRVCEEHRVTEADYLATRIEAVST